MKIKYFAMYSYSIYAFIMINTNHLEYFEFANENKMVEKTPLPKSNFSVKSTIAIA